MTQTTTIPAVNINTNDAYSSDVFYGSFRTHVNGKSLDVSVSNHIKDVNKTYNFRAAAKCRAGFVNISDFTDTPQGAICNWKKNALVNLQVEVEFESGVKQWHNVYTTKAMRQSFPDMCDMNIWEYVGAKTWADKAFAK